MHHLIYIVLLTLISESPTTRAFNHGAKDIDLDMAKNSAAYLFTQSPAADQAAIDYIKKEWKYRRAFLKVWEIANREVGNYSKIPPGLRREHLMAIHAYTQNSSLNWEFNNAIRQYGKIVAIYLRHFRFKSFHYLLSVALARLKAGKRHTFWGVKELFDATNGRNVRLGQFASSSLSKMDALRFISQNQSRNTLFKINTKFGVPIVQYSTYNAEKMILIPPNEVFRVNGKPEWVNEGKKRWREIKLEAAGCQGIPVTVGTLNGILVVRSGGKCPKHCKCVIA